MQAEADLILERRRMRRRLALWRVLAIVAFLLVAALVVPWPSPVAQSYVARVPIDGIILEDPDRDEMIAKLAEDEAVKAVILRISSPGGTVVGSEALYEALRDLAEAKPVVAVMGEAAASGAYLAAIATDHIVARGNTMTGSIGVIAEIPNVEGLLEMAGIEVTRVRSSPLKAEPGFTSRPSPEGIAAEEAIIADAYLWFRGLVGERRGLDGAALDAVADGRVFTGRQALEVGLIDAIGGEDVARAWLTAERGIDADLGVVERDWREDEVPWPFSLFGKMGDFLGGSPVSTQPFPRLLAVIR